MGIDVALWRARIGLFKGGRVPRSLKGLLASLLHRKCHTATPHRHRDKTDNSGTYSRKVNAQEQTNRNPKGFKTRPSKEEERTSGGDQCSQRARAQTDSSDNNDFECSNKSSANNLNVLDNMSCDQTTRHYDSLTVSTLNKMVYAIFLFSLALLLIVAGDVEINPGPTGIDTVLNIEDLPTVCSQLHDASPQWFHLGLVLELDHTTLTGIRQTVESDSERLREMISTRLQSSTPLTWADLCAGLRDQTVGQNDLAVRIEESIKQSPLDLELEPQDMAILAQHFDSPELYMDLMGLNPGEKIDVRMKAQVAGNHAAMIECFTAWKKHATLHKPSQATYRCLLDILQRLKKDKIAANVQQYLASQYPSVIIEWSSPHPQTQPLSITTGGQLQLSSPTPVQLSPLTTTMTGSHSVADYIKNFEQIFFSLRTTALECIKASGISIKKFRQTLMTLPSTMKNEHEQFLLEKYPLFKNADSIECIFVHLNFYLSFIDFSLLEHIIEHFGDDSLKTTMKRYAEDMRQFRSSTTIMEALPHLPKRPKPSSDYSTLDMKADIDISKSTLEQLEELRRRFASELSLSQFALSLLEIHEGSVILKWLIPSEFAYYTRHFKYPETTILQLCVLKLALNGDRVYPYPRKQAAGSAQSSAALGSTIVDPGAEGVVNKPTGQFTPEYLALRKNYRELIGFLKKNPQLGDEILQELIRFRRKNPQLGDEILLRYPKTLELMDAILKAVEHDPNVYNTFCMVLTRFTDLEPKIERQLRSERSTISAPKPVQLTPEYLALRRRYRLILRSLDSQCEEVCDALHASGYLPSFAWASVRSASTGKARILIDAVMNEVEQDTNVYYAFVSSLKDDIVVKELRDTLQSAPLDASAAMATNNFGQPSTEYLVLRKSSSLLLYNLQRTQLEEMCDIIFESSYIAPDKRESLRSEEAFEIMNCLNAEVKQNSQVYHNFLKSIQQSFPWGDIVVKQLNERYQTEHQEALELTKGNVSSEMPIKFKTVGQTTPEYIALKKAYRQMDWRLSHHNHIDLLIEKGLLAPSHRQQIESTETLWNTLFDKVERNPDAYFDVVESLRDIESGSHTETLLKQFQTVRKSLAKGKGLALLVNLSIGVPHELKSRQLAVSDPASTFEELGLIVLEDDAISIDQFAEICSSRHVWSLASRPDSPVVLVLNIVSTNNINIKEDIIEPFLSSSAPYIAHNPKIVFIKQLNTRVTYTPLSEGNILVCLIDHHYHGDLNQQLLTSRESIPDILIRCKEESSYRGTIKVMSTLNQPVYLHPDGPRKSKTCEGLALFVNVSKSDSITHHTREPQRLVEARTFQELGFSVVEEDATELTDLANIYRRHLTGSPSPDCPVVVVLTLNGWSWSRLHSFELTQHILHPLLPLQVSHLTHSPKIVIIQGDLRMSSNMMRYGSHDMPAEGNYLVCLIDHHYVYHDGDLNKELLTSRESIQDTLMWCEDESKYSGRIKVMSTLNQPVYLHPHGPPKSRTGQNPAVKATELTVARQRRADKINSAINSSPKPCGLAIVLGVNRWETESTEIAKTFAETLNFAVVEEYNIQTTRKLTDIIFAASHLVEYPKTQDCPIVVFAMWNRAEVTIEALECGDGTINISEDIIKPLLPPSSPHLADNPKIFIINTGTWKLEGTPTFKLPDSGNFVLCYTQFKDVHVIKQASEAFSKAFTQSSDSVDKVLERMKDDNPSLKMQVISHLNRPVHLFPGSSDPAGTTHSKPDDATKQKFLPKDTKPVVIPLKSGSHKGIDVTERLSIDVTSSEGTFNFEDCGLKISIPEDALPTGIGSCHLDITISLSGQYKFPEGHQLVSAVPWIRCTPPCRFKKPIRVDIQHCARKEAVKNLRFVKASCTQETRPYLFKTLDGRGSFSDSSSYGVIELNGFSGLAITCTVNPPIRKHAISLYYLRQPNHWKIHLVVTWDLKPHIEGVNSYYNKEGATKGAGISGAEIEGEAVSVNIPLPDGILVGQWKLVPLVQPSLPRARIDYYDPGKEIPHIQIKAILKTSVLSSTSELPYYLTLNGVKEPNIIGIDIDPPSVTQVESDPSPPKVYLSSKYWNLGVVKEKCNGEGVLVAVLDTGVNKHHKAFKETRSESCPIKFGRNFTKVPPPKGDANNYEYVDSDPDSHGTAVAGVLAGSHQFIVDQIQDIKEKYNFSMFETAEHLPLGVAPKCSLVICRVGTSAPTLHAVVKALKWVYEHNCVVMGSTNQDAHMDECTTELHQEGQKSKICIVNMSFKFSVKENDPIEDHDSLQRIRDYITKLNEQHVICVAGAGNDGNNRDPGYPALYENVLSVGSVDHYGCVSNFSTQHPTRIDVYALGQDVLVAINKSTNKKTGTMITGSPPAAPPPPPIPSSTPTTSTNTGEQDEGTFKIECGTSFATPAVSGLIAILLQHARQQDSEFNLADKVTDLNTLKKFLEKHIMSSNSQVPKLLRLQEVEGFFHEREPTAGINNMQQALD